MNSDEETLHTVTFSSTTPSNIIYSPLKSRGNGSPCGACGSLCPVGRRLKLVVTVQNPSGRLIVSTTTWNPHPQSAVQLLHAPEMYLREMFSQKPFATGFHVDVENVESSVARDDHNLRAVAAHRHHASQGPTRIAGTTGSSVDRGPC